MPSRYQLDRALETLVGRFSGLVNLAFVMKTQMVNNGGLAFQSAARHEGHLQLLEVII